MIIMFVKNLKKKSKKRCSYCYYNEAKPDDNLCQECRDYLNKVSKIKIK